MNVSKDPYTLDSFIYEVESLVSSGDPESAVVAGTEKALARLMDSGSIPEEFCTPADRPAAEDEFFGFRVYRLHRSNGDTFNLTTAVWPAGSATGVHDHAGKWVVEGVYRNSLQLQEYRRVDDGALEGHAELIAGAPLDVDAGEVSHVLSPEIEIHEWRNVSDKPTVTVHVWGADAANQTVNYFDVEADTYQPVTHEVHFHNEL